MHDERVEKLADLLVNYSVAVRPGDKVIIQGGAMAEPLVKAVYVKALQAGGYPLVWVDLPGMWELTYHYSSDDQLRYIHTPMRQVIEAYDVLMNLGAESNTKALSRVDPGKMIIRHQANREIFETYLSRAAKGELRWTTTLFPTNASAQDAEMSLEEYEDFVYGACLPDLKDPINYWKRFSARQQRVVDWLKGKKKVHVIGPNTDLWLGIEGRSFINCDCHENVPDGEVFTGPIENSVEGQVCFSYPAIYAGHEVEGVRLWFENGKVIKASAAKNQEFLIKTLDTDEGSRYVGEFAIGTNEGITQFTRDLLFDEKIAGSFHMALGAGYPESGSKNQSTIHWDMICDLRQGGEIWVDDALLYKDGKFTIDME